VNGHDCLSSALDGPRIPCLPRGEEVALEGRGAAHRRRVVRRDAVTGNVVTASGGQRSLGVRAHSAGAPS